MCAVSQIIGYMEKEVPVERWTVGTFNKLQLVLAELNELDAMLGHHDCIDPEKQAYLNQVVNSVTAKLQKGI
jgi:hypothetical protein